MPQLNPEFFVSQLFWLVITFSFLFFFLWKISLPRIGSVIEKREKKINNDLETAKQLQTEAEDIQKQIEQELKSTRDKTADLIRSSTVNFQNNTSEELAQLEKKLNQQLNDAAKIIESNKKKSLQEIDEQIYDITKITVSKLSSIHIQDEEIKSFVNKEQSKVSV